MRLQIIAFTDRGFLLAKRMERMLTESGQTAQAMRCGEPFGLTEWTKRHFDRGNGLIYVGAAGIAVRAIAPYIKDKASDPAVVVVDEKGLYAVPVLSGHLGGANDLARLIGRCFGAQPVITTATDVNGVFAVDEWARYQGCAVLETERIKRISSRLLAGERVGLRSYWPIKGTPPAGVDTTEEGKDISLTIKQESTQALHLVPVIGVLGIGCRKGVSVWAVEEAFERFIGENSLYPEAVKKVCSIDLKKGEPGILAFCQNHGFSYETFPADRLQAVSGSFSASDFVRSVTGVDNVCERSAVLGAGLQGRLYMKKRAENGVTMALALMPFAPDWRWRDE